MPPSRVAVPTAPFGTRTAAYAPPARSVRVRTFPASRSAPPGRYTVTRRGETVHRRRRHRRGHQAVSRKGAAGRAVLISLVLALLVGSTACTSDDSAAASHTAGPTVIASTTWVGALAKAAGATDIAVIAPATIPNQAAFNPTPAELAALPRAKHVLYAESDGFAAAVRSAAGKARLVAVKPMNTPAVIRAEVTRLGEIFGTQAAAARWLSEFEAEAKALSNSLTGLAPIPALTAVAHTDVAHWAVFTGVRVIASYGPAPVSKVQLADLVAKKPNLLLANVHQPAGTPRVPGATRVDLVNYPGQDLDLMAVFNTNADRVSATFTQRQPG